MALRTLWILAWRDVGRNRRRSALTMLAVALGLALLIILNSWIAGILGDSLQNAIRLDTGHVQLRASSYEQDKLSLRGSELVSELEPLVARAQALPEVTAASPVLWMGGVLTTRDEAVNLRVVGLDPRSSVHAPLQQALVAGAWLAADDRSGILMGRRLADSLGVGVGQKVNVAIINSDGQPDEGSFTVRGLFATGIPSYDDSAVLMPLAKAQAFAAVRGLASAVVIMLKAENDAEAVAAQLQGTDTVALTWRDLMQTLLQGLDTAMSFYIILDGIVMLVVAVVIANTLLMAIFERVREMGILAALGMKGRQVIQMILLEATILGLAGIAVGIVLGLVFVAYLAVVGVNLGESVASAAGNIAVPTVMRARFVPGTTLGLAAWTLLIILLAALYPARFAARLEPVEALRQS